MAVKIWVNGSDAFDTEAIAKRLADKPKPTDGDQETDGRQTFASFREESVRHYVSC